MRKKIRGVKTLKTSNKNRRAEIYYRRVIKTEITKYVESLPINETEIKTDPQKQNVFGKNAELIVIKFLNLLKKDSEKYLTVSVGKFLGLEESNKKNKDGQLSTFIAIDYDKDTYDDTFKAILESNVKLITNTADRTINNIQQALYDNIIEGKSAKNLKEIIKEQTELSDKRIKLIARDQTAKANQVLNRIGQQEAGIEYFRWNTAHDERVSEGYGGHKQLDGKIYKWGDVENYPIINAKGERGIPSQRPNCRCDAQAVIIEDGYKAVKNKDGSYNIIKG